MAKPQLQRSPEAPEDDLVDGKMGFLEHLDELRTRLIRACLAVAAGMLIAFLFVERISNFVLAPTLRMLPPGSELVFIRPGENFSFYFDIALIGGVVLAAPFVLYQIWGFIAPGLYATEKKFVVPFVAFATIGTLGGALFSHYLLYPAMMGFFGAFHSPGVKFMPSVEYTFELYKNLLLAMVLVFQLPTLAFFLAKMRLVTAQFLWRKINYAILAIFIVAAVLTPSPDPWNQAIFAVPMMALYVISIGIAWIVGPKREPQASGNGGSTGLRLVIGAMAVDRAMNRRHPRRAPAARHRFL